MDRRLIPSFGQAVDGLRAYWKTAALLAAAGAWGLSLLLPVVALAGSAGLTGAPRIQMESPGISRSGLAWSELAREPAALHAWAVSDLYVSLLLAGAAGLAVTILTVLSFSAAREREREIELAIRRAVGASRLTLLGSALLEGGMLSAVALGAAMVSAGILSATELASWPGPVGPGVLAPRMYLAVVVSGATIFGAVVPVLFARRRQVVQGVGGPMPLTIPSVQLGLSLIVLTAGTLLTGYAGLEPGHVSSMAGSGTVYRITLADSSPSVRSLKISRILEETRRGNTELISLSAIGNLVGLGTMDVLRAGCVFCPDGVPRGLVDTMFASYRLVSADTFRALGVHLVEGRLLTESDRLGSAPVAVVNELLAGKLAHPIGALIRVADDPFTYTTVVGVVDESPGPGLGSVHQTRNVVYLSLLQHPAKSLDLLVRPDPDGAGRRRVETGVARVLGTPIDPSAVTTEAGLSAAELAPVRWFARRYSELGWSMLALAFAALLALMRLWVASLRTELGLRMAVGASRLRLMALVLGRTTAVGAAGIAVGLWFGPALWGGIRDLLPQLPGWDPAILSGYALVLMIAALAGAVGPAWHAIRMAPAALIESEG